MDWCFIRFAGPGLVLGFDIGSKIPMGLIATIIALLAITFSTMAKKLVITYHCVSNMDKAIGGCLFHLLIIILFVDPYINSQNFYYCNEPSNIFGVIWCIYNIDVS